MNILVIRPGAIGDSLLAFPVLHLLRTRNAHVHITFVSNPAVLALARSWFLADEVADYTAPLWSELFLAPKRHSQTMRAVLERTDVAICWLRDSDGAIKRSLSAYTIRKTVLAPGRPQEGTPLHITAYLLQTIGLSTEIHWSLPGKEPSWVGFKKDANEKAIALHPGSGGARKCWPVPHFAAIIHDLWQRAIPVLLLAGPAEQKRLTELLPLISSPPHPSLLTTLQDAPLLEVARQLAQCRGYLGNDSGITHLAALLGVPTIALFGPSDPRIWQPLAPTDRAEQTVHILHEPHIAHIMPDVVKSAIEAFIL